MALYQAVVVVRNSSLDDFHPLSFSPICLLGYDVLLLATPERHMTGLDMSATCVDKLNKVSLVMNDMYVDPY